MLVSDIYYDDFHLLTFKVNTCDMIMMIDLESSSRAIHSHDSDSDSY